MATKKQRRRREKELRHEYVWVDEEGNEIDAAEATSTSKQVAKSAPTRGREPQAPSLRRSLKRGLIFAPIMLATVMLLSNDLTLYQQISQTLFIVAVFIPFSYFLDRMFFRSFQRRAAKGSGAGGGRGS